MALIAMEILVGFLLTRSLLIRTAASPPPPKKKILSSLHRLIPRFPTNVQSMTVYLSFEREAEFVEKKRRKKLDDVIKIMQRRNSL